MRVHTTRLVGLVRAVQFYNEEGAQVLAWIDAISVMLRRYDKRANRYRSRANTVTAGSGVQARDHARASRRDQRGASDVAGGAHRQYGDGGGGAAAAWDDDGDDNNGWRTPSGEYEPTPGDDGEGGLGAYVRCMVVCTGVTIADWACAGATLGAHPGAAMRRERDMETEYL